MTLKNLDAFTFAYLECALWAETDQSTPQGGKPLDQNYSILDFAPEALREAVEDCKRFQEQHADLLERADYGHARYSNNEMAGHDFWLTRNGHGAGFWDRDFDTGHSKSRLALALTEAAEAFGECWIYVGDDGRLYLN